MISSLIEYEFLQNAFITGFIIGIIAPILGVFIVVRKQALIADALSHITLSGIAASLLLGSMWPAFSEWKPLYGGMIFSVAGALLIEKLRSVYKHYEELAIPIIMSFGIGLGVIFISMAGFPVDLFGFLFGSVSAVSREDLYIVLGIGALVVGTVFFLYKGLFLLSFDEEHGHTLGLPSKMINFLFILIVALVIAVSMRIVGILLVSSLMTLPVASSIRIAKSFKQTIVLSVLFGETAVIGGLVSAYYLELAPGGTIVVISAFILLLSILYKNIGINFRSGREGK